MVLFRVLVVQFVRRQSILTKHTHKDGCPFCLENGKVKVIREVDEAYLAQTLSPSGEVMPGRYFIIPKAHITSIIDLPLNFLQPFLFLLTCLVELSEGAHYNISINSGRKAGQRLEHFHIWVIIREGEEGKPSQDLGMAALINDLNKTSDEPSGPILTAER